MNDTSPEKKTTDVAATKRGNDKPGAKMARANRLSGGLALILAAIALVGSGYLWYLLFFERPELITTDIAGRLEKAEGQDSSLREQLGGLAEQAQVQRDNQDAIKITLDKIHSDLTRSRTEWLLTESEQLLVIANHRLQMARDVRSALAALRAADQQLKLVVSPNILPVRKELAREIGLLDALEKVDVNGIALRLGTLAEGVERLPLAPEARWPKDKTSTATKNNKADTKPEADSGWRAALRSLWRDLQNLVRLRTDSETQKPLLPPEQQYFLRENLRLMLYGAQNALLQGSVVTYQQNVKSAARRIREYYDVNTQGVVATLAELDKLAAIKLTAELPDISASLEALRRLNGRQTTP